MPSQSELIGDHPSKPSQFHRWLSCCDCPVTLEKCHRMLTEIIPSNDPVLINWLSDKIIEHHYTDENLIRLKNMYNELGFVQYAEQTRKLPRADKTKKGNAAEILLFEYISECLNKPLIRLFRLRYNQNVDQAMKGDDVLIIEHEKLNEGRIKIYLGEAKFRKTPGKAVINDISICLKSDKMPISYQYLIDMLERDADTMELAMKLDRIILEDIKRRDELIYIGMLVSNLKVSSVVEDNLKSDNSNFVFVSIGLDNPSQFIEGIYEKAEGKIKSGSL